MNFTFSTAWPSATWRNTSLPHAVKNLSAASCRTWWAAPGSATKRRSTSWWTPGPPIWPCRRPISSSFTTVWVIQSTRLDGRRSCRSVSGANWFVDLAVNRVAHGIHRRHNDRRRRRRSANGRQRSLTVRPQSTLKVISKYYKLYRIIHQDTMYFANSFLCKIYTIGRYSASFAKFSPRLCHY